MIKKIVCCMLFLCATKVAAQQNTDLDRYFHNLQKVIAITQEAAQKAIAQTLNNPTRAVPTHETIGTTICNAIEEEIQKIKDENSQLTDEQQEILHLLEQYLAQYQAYSSFAPVA